MAFLAVEDLSEIFSDLTPIPQDDGPEPVCVIAYPTSFRIAYDYMRAVWACKEFSERSLKLTALCLRLNPANYTVWHYRRQCLEALGRHSDPEAMQKDLDLASSLGGDNPKNYQIWYHRRALLECVSLPDFLQGELDYIHNVLEEDSKNYHAWSHRQWVVRTVDDEEVWKKEIEYANELIQEDSRNNSAWNQRWFACHRGRRGPLLLDVAKHEADYAIHTGATLDPYNESPWRYLIGVLKEQWKIQPDPELMRDYEEKASRLRKVLSDAHKDPDTCVNLTSARIDLYEMKGDKESLKAAAVLAGKLAAEHDPIRTKYWALRVDEMGQKIAALLS